MGNKRRANRVPSKRAKCRTLRLQKKRLEGMDVSLAGAGEIATPDMVKTKNKSPRVGKREMDSKSLGNIVSSSDISSLPEETNTSNIHPQLEPIKLVWNRDIHGQWHRKRSRKPVSQWHKEHEKDSKDVENHVTPRNKRLSLPEEDSEGHRNNVSSSLDNNSPLPEETLLDPLGDENAVVLPCSNTSPQAEKVAQDPLSIENKVVSPSLNVIATQAEKLKEQSSITHVSPIVLQSPFSAVDNIESQVISQQNDIAKGPGGHKARPIDYYARECKRLYMKEYRKRKKEIKKNLESPNKTSGLHSKRLAPVNVCPQKSTQRNLYYNKELSDSVMKARSALNKRKPIVSTSRAKDGTQSQAGGRDVETTPSSAVTSNGAKSSSRSIEKTSKISKTVKPSNQLSEPLIISYANAKSSGRYCVVPTCTPEVCVDPHFSFPKDKGLCLKWLLAVPKGEWTLSDKSVVCSRHFEKDDLIKEGNSLTLTTNATPKLFLTSNDTPPNDESPATISLSSQDVGDLTITENVAGNCGDSCESDLEIIEPEIETFEVSDSSEEECNSVKEKPPKVEPGTSGVPKIRCCVPRCGSISGIPKGVGFHSFPRIGETRLSVKSLDNKVTFHDLFSMWKSLLSVPAINETSFVCTRHFTPNDYNGNFLNKAAVPTQYLPTPVMFAPFRAAAENVANTVALPPLVLINKRPPPPIIKKNNILSLASSQRGRSAASKYIRIPVPSKRNSYSDGKSISSERTFVSKAINTAISASAISTTVMKTIPSISVKDLPQSSSSSVLPSLPDDLHCPFDQTKLICSIGNCPDKGKGRFLFRLPYSIDKCKEWVYSCGYPEWLDKGMYYAQTKFRICSYHFSDDMFLNDSRKLLKGSAKPVLHVQEPYKKCVVKFCQNYFDKQRLFLIGVEFSTFPENVALRKQWIQNIKNPKASSRDTLEVTDDEIESHKDSVICSLHFKSGDYLKNDDGKVLKPTAVPSMNLITKENNPQMSSNEANETGPVRKTYATRGRRISRGAHRGSLRERRNESQNLKATSSGVENPNSSDQSQLTVKKLVRSRWRGKRRRGSRRGRIARQSSGQAIPDRNFEASNSTQQTINEEDVKAIDRVKPTTTKEQRNTVSVERKKVKSRPEILYSRTGRPMRATVLKRKYVTEGSEEEEEDDEDEKPLSRRRKVLQLKARSVRQTYCEDSSLNRGVGVRRSSRTAALNRKSVIDSHSDESVGSSLFEERDGCNNESDVDRAKVLDLLTTELPPSSKDCLKKSMKAENCVKGKEETVLKEEMVPTNNEVEEDIKSLDNPSIIKSNDNDKIHDISTSENLSDKESNVNNPRMPDKIKQNEKKENTIPFGPDLPKPNRSDFDFFQSILPTFGKFNLNQKSALKSTIISKLKELLEEDTELFDSDVNAITT